MDEDNHAVNVSAATINQSNKVTSFLQIVPVSIQSVGNRLNTYVFLNSESTVSFIDQNVQEKLRAQGIDVTLNIVGIILGQDAYELQRPLDYKIGTQSEPFAVQES